MAVANNVVTTNRVRKTLIVDSLLLVFIYFIPTLSHAFSVPLYLFEPMRVALFVSILLLRNRNNAYILAVTLPLFSFFVAGHPVAVKNVIMGLELLVNVFFFCKLIDRKVNPFLSCLVSIIISKVLYYILKFTAINAGLLATRLVDTSLYIQLIIAVVLSLGLWVSYNHKENRSNG